MLKKGLFFTALLISALSVFSAMPEPEGDPNIFIDSYDRHIRLPENIDSIVSLTPSVTETLYALGVGDKVTGVTNYCNFPAEARAVPKVGDLLDPSVEVIYNLNPDLVIASTHNTRETVDLLEALGVAVVVITNEDTIEGVLKSIEETAIVTGSLEAGLSLIETIKARIYAVKQAVAGRTPPRVYYVISYGEYGDFTAGSDTFINELITIAGGKNVVTSEGWSYSIEQLMIDDPDMLICPSYKGFTDNLITAPGYSFLTAVKTDQVFVINNDIVDRQGPRIAEAVEELAKIFHPGILNTGE